MARGHHHICDWCKAEYDCHAPIVSNYDGLPERLCILVLEGDQLICPECEDEWQEREREADHVRH